MKLWFVINFDEEAFGLLLDTVSFEDVMIREYEGKLTPVSVGRYEFLANGERVVGLPFSTREAAVEHLDKWWREYFERHVSYTKRLEERISRLTSELAKVLRDDHIFEKDI